MPWPVLLPDDPIGRYHWPGPRATGHGATGLGRKWSVIVTVVSSPSYWPARESEQEVEADIEQHADLVQVPDKTHGGDANETDGSAKDDHVEVVPENEETYCGEDQRRERHQYPQR